MMEIGPSGANRLKILIGAGVPKRREGGVAAIIYNLGRELERLGHKITYIFLDDLVAPGSVSPRFGEIIFSARLAHHIAKNRQEFSVVNLHAPAGLIYGLQRRYLHRQNYPPYVMTLHGLEERRVHVMTREGKKGRAWNFGWKNRLWHRLYHFPRFRWSIRTADGAHAYSRDVWNVLQLRYGLNVERVAYIASGVEQRFFTPRQYERREGVRLLYAGTWLDQRGIFYLREALQNLPQRVPDWSITIAGPGAPAQEIRRFFGEELAQRVVVLPVVEAERMPALYSEHDIFVFPSLMEGLPSVLLEAMASGMPVITTETCGMPDIVRNECNGLLIPPADAAALQEAILRLMTSLELRQKLGEEARTSMRMYTWERAARQLEALFQRVLAAEGRSASEVKKSTLAHDASSPEIVPNTEIHTQR
jgi:glycosyltransferase involved in cell wall biosynthesis